jgi:hypothetical protein
MSKSLSVGASQTLFTWTVNDFDPTKFGGASLSDITRSIWAVVINYIETAVRYNRTKLRQQTSDILTFVVSRKDDRNTHSFLL